MAGTAQQGKTKGGGTGKLVMTGLLMLPVVAVLLPSCIVLTVNMVPTIVAYVVDRSREKYLAITVGLLNICGTLPALVGLWQRGQSYDAALDIAGNPFHWLMAYGAAGIGWLVYLGLPPILRNYYGITSQARLLNHQRKQKILVEAWGEEVRGEITEARGR
ncbi:MAG: hypothetical protein ACTSQ7_06445 [Alphaproteobacteria bacterium]